ncbi:hypothetical protein IV102_21890 [bacterium]|nr:hypothetical protein [bacterium]
MSSYFYELYFVESVQPATVREQIMALAGVKPDPEFPDQYWVGRVHLMLDCEDAEEMIDSIEPRTGIRTGSFSLDVGVHSFSQDDTNLMLDVVMDILAEREDAVAVYLSERIMFMQKDGRVYVDPSQMSEDSVDHLRRRRECQEKDLGPVF